MEKIIGKFQAWENFGFLIPKNREYYWWDFFVSKKHFWWAKDWDMVEWAEVKSKGKKPEARIVKVLTWNKDDKNNIYVEGIFSKEWEFWFVDIPWQTKWIFVHSKNTLSAEDWDKVKAHVVEYNWKKEAKIVKIFEREYNDVEWIFKDNDSYWFVLTKENGDIFIPWFKKNWATNWDNVIVRITKEWKKNKEGIIIKVI